MHATKEKIIQTAIELFNQKGMVHVRLQHIADASDISVGNLAYHYYSKKAIVAGIDGKLEEEISPVLSKTLDFSSLIDFDNHLSRYYFLINRYSFYFLDLLEMERAYPHLHRKRKDYILQMIDQIEDWMQLNKEKEILLQELEEGQYHLAAQAIWMIITFWLTYSQLNERSSNSEGDFKEVVWNQLLPLFTTNGKLEYEAFILP